MPTVPGLAVLLDDGTGTFPTDITNKVLAMVGYEITRGRDDWQGAVTAGELTMTLNNSDGRFTPGSTILGSPSPIKVDQRIRLKETVNGVTYTRYTGYVKSWPVAWPEVVTTFSTVQLTATDAQARAERWTLQPMLVEEILVDSPSAYYPLTEPQGSTAAGDISGNQAPALTPSGTGTAPTFGTSTGPTDGEPAPTFTGGQGLSTVTTGSPFVHAGNAWSIVAVFTTTAVVGLGLADGVVQLFGPVAQSVDVRLVTGVLGLGSGGGMAIPLSGSFNDGGLHCAIGTFDGTSHLRFYVDGVLAGVSAGGSPVTGAGFTTLTLGGDATGTGALGSWTGMIDHVAVYDGVVLSAGEAAAISDLALGTQSETADARIARIAGYVSIPTGTLDASVTSVPAQATSGVSAQDALQEVADAEMGLVFIDGSGNLTFHNRGRVTSKTTPDLTLDSQYVTPDVQPVTDDQQIVNYVEATAAGTGGVSIVRDAASETTHGRYPVSQSYLVQTDEEAMSRGQWVVAKQAEPSARYGTLTINLYKMTAAQASATLAALDLDCWLRVTSMASQTPGGTTVDVVVQGWHAVTTAESWAITCNVVPFSLFQAAIWDDPGSLWDTAVWAV